MWSEAALSGSTVATAAVPGTGSYVGYLIDTQLPSTIWNNPDRVESVLMNWGVNDMEAAPDQATWVAQYSSIVTLVHNRFPAADIYLSYPWRVGYDAAAAVMHGWVDEVIALHPGYAHPGVDEAVAIKMADDGWLATDASTGGSGVHYTVPFGANEYAKAMATALGYPPP